LQAAHGWLLAAGEKPEWGKLAAGFSDPVAGSEVRPEKQAALIYGKLIEKYAACERAVLEQIGG
jgi:hypothetical protein